MTAVGESSDRSTNDSLGDSAGWEVVVGLEVHCELATATKLFCGCPNRFGDPPNTNICPVCLGLPGSLPVLNEQAVELAMRLARALHCTVQRSIFARKNYFYPDMPKNYQISQYDLPLNIGGWIDLPTGHRVGMVRAHLEEDTGKSRHVGSGAAGGGRIHDAAYSLVDYNRSGVPLLEIVSRPDIRSAEQARIYVSELRAIMLATGASDARMEEGSLRIDANVSVHRPGEAFGTRCEIKNLNSLRSLGRAIDYEARRQIDVLEAGQSVEQETRHWDDGVGRTSTLRTKEEAQDYRYFPEPDLVPLDPDEGWIARIDRTLPPLPVERRVRLAEVAARAPTDSAVTIAVERNLDGLAVEAIDAGADAGRVLTHVEHNLAIEGADRLEPQRFAALVAMETDGTLTATQAKAVLTEMVATGDDPEAIAKDKGFEAMSADAVGAVVDQVIADNPDEWSRFVDGDDKLRGKLTGFFVGQVMRATKGQADGKAVTALLRERAGL
jgi:aspartyl-tRNA(Asn)/glutamyl-tRNA(Gln) amidotransferase subunit B